MPLLRSVAVIIWVPGVTSVAPPGNVCMPLSPVVMRCCWPDKRSRRQRHVVVMRHRAGVTDGHLIEFILRRYGHVEGHAGGGLGRGGDIEVAGAGLVRPDVHDRRCAPHPVGQPGRVGPGRRCSAPGCRGAAPW